MPQVVESVKAVAAMAVETSKNTATPVIAENLYGTVYTETVVAEKTISYEEAAVIVADLEKKKLITKEGKICDSLKPSLQQGSLI